MRIKMMISFLRILHACALKATKGMIQKPSDARSIERLSLDVIPVKYQFRWHIHYICHVCTVRMNGLLCNCTLLECIFEHLCLILCNYFNASIY